MVVGSRGLVASPPAASGMASNPTSSASPALRQYKDALVPRRFSNNSLPPFCPLTLHLPAPPHQVVPQAALSSPYSLRSPPPPNSPDTTRPVGIMPQRDRLALIR